MVHNIKVQKHVQKKLIRKSNMVRVGLQIRFEVMNVINKNPLKSVKLPSAQELADKFGMSRRSVTMELKKLADEGWIIGIHGMKRISISALSGISGVFPENSSFRSRIIFWKIS